MATERREDYTISESYELPSKGLIYDAKVNPRVELRSMTARDEMKRLNPSSTPLKLLADIIEGCMLEKPAVHVYDMAIGDYEYLLHKLRTVTYGANYPVTLICPNCGETVETSVDLGSLELKPFDKDEFDSLRNISLPASGKRVTLNFQTPKIMDDIDLKAKELKRQRKSSDINLDVYAQLLYAIKSVDDKPFNSTDLDYLLEEISARDLNKIRKSIDKLNAYLGLDNSFTVACPKCGEDISTFFRFGPEFFGPDDD